MRPHFPLTPPTHLLLTPHPPQLSPTDLTQLTKNCLGGGVQGDEKKGGAAGAGYDLFVYVGELSELVATPLYCCTRVNIG